ncbi:formimidoylglutamate deiminase [Myceligenerans pegani]|uniref:Formimidoylglutamate deiminase n=1 Tax=Myceligenerans pegani TaxID=2776917 RepID=A0ABR9N084_9MICO|nr:formimidoylglutamate deiminase [Myceligenerans sp. TRM 65318]MBE1877065.1 formimidoylglutamate deiminase [Myceligenerans sp. TRM 65318]MBE3019336.1 formimidoylglutamate deiminase [Myceligenerans sp. TRM 65318]
MSSWFCDYAWTGRRVAADVVIRTEGGWVTEVTTGVVGKPDGATRLRGLTLPAFANGHSHAFHRALRGRTHSVDDGGRGPGSGSFWTWREQMYRVAERLDPDSYHRLARALYAEMVLAGYGVVGEFHYLHHAPGGQRYTDPNAMGEALIAAADDAGIRLTLLDTCYLTAGVAGDALNGVQRRFGDGDAESWADRVDSIARSHPADVAAAAAVATSRPRIPGQLPGTGPAADDRSPDGLVRIGAAIHSVRAVPPSAIETVAERTAARGAPLHVHLSEQPRENEDCLAAHGRTPTGLLADHGALSARTTAVHATHLTVDDVDRLAASETRACITRTTERDLADGAPDLGRIADAGIGLCVGSDSNAIVDPFEETRGLELDERSRTLGRGHLSPATLLGAGTREGYASLGWLNPTAGPGSAGIGLSHETALTGRIPWDGIRVGDLADLTVVSLESVRMAGWSRETLLDHAVFAATAADVTDTIIAGRHVVRDRTHTTIPHPAAALHQEIRTLLDHP